MPMYNLIEYSDNYQDSSATLYWKEHKTKVQTENTDNNVFKYINLDPSFQGINTLKRRI